MAQLGGGDVGCTVHDTPPPAPLLPRTVRVAGSLSTALPGRRGLMATQTYCPASTSSTAEMLSVLLTCFGESTEVDTLSRGESPGETSCESCVQ